MYYIWGTKSISTKEPEKRILKVKDWLKFKNTYMNVTYSQGSFRILDELANIPQIGVPGIPDHLFKSKEESVTLKTNSSDENIKS